MAARRILILENGVSGGGSFESACLLAMHLDRSRYEPIVAFVNVTHHAERLRAAGVAVRILEDPVYSKEASSWGRRIRVQAARGIAHAAPWLSATADASVHRSTIVALQRLMSDERIALIHLNNQSIRDFYGAVVARALGVPCVSHLRSVRVRAVTAGHLRVLHASVGQFIANSEYTRTAWAQFGIDRARITVIPNAIVQRPVAPVDIRTRWGIPSAVRHIIGCVGNLTEGKGQATFVRAFAELRRRRRDVAAVVVGEGVHRAALERDATALGLRESITFTGYVPDAQAVIAALDALVLPSESETFGRTILEAMVQCVPVVATRVGGIPEVVADGYDGLLVPSGDHVALAVAMGQLLDRAAWTRTLTTHGAETVQRYDPVRHANAVSAVYDEVTQHAWCTQ